MRTLRFIFAVFFLGVSSSAFIFADQEVHDIIPEVASETSSSTQTDTASNQPKAVESYKLEDSTKSPSLSQAKAPLNSPKEQKSEGVSKHFRSTKCFQPPKSVFFQTNIGVGFLYFSGLRGNLMGQPVDNFDPPSSAWRDAPLKGRLSYNRTPLFEYLLGYRFNSWLKLALSYQYQGGITIQSKAVSAFTIGGGPRFSAFIKFSSNLSLNALLAKVYLELPFAMVWRSLSINPYLAFGVGPGSQSWTQTQTYNMEGNTFFSSEVLYLQQKTSFNAVWMTDLGLQMQKAASTNQFSVVMGCKYNQWGQARNIGQMSQQGAHKLALTHPFRIRTIYQFAPYLGFQWNFLPNLSAGPTYKLKGKNPKVWLPYWVASSEFQCPSNVWTQFNAGIGFLYFGGLRGNLMGQPVLNFAPATSWRDAPFKGRLSYKRTPLFEYLLGYQFNSWLKLALSYQHQGGVAIQSRALSAFPPQNNLGDSAYVQFSSNLSLDAILAKVYFELPFAMIWRNLSTNPYLAVGVGPGWQSWSRIRVNYSNGANFYQGASLPLHQKISANAVWMVDTGLRMQSASIANRFSVVMGCKYNQWGQARSIGKMSQQGAHKLALTQPLRIRTVYQFSPYLGVQWNFSTKQYSKSPYKLRGKGPNVWVPYWVSSNAFQCPTNIWVQFNTGVGFLYLSGIKGNLMGLPVLNFSTVDSWRDVPLKGRFSYNRTPLFEYLLGYQFNFWLKLALSYQHQGGIIIQSKALSAYQAPGATDSGFVQFTSNLSLDALLAKVYFELPFAMIWRNISTNPYLAVGVGPGWQSWTKIEVDYMRRNTTVNLESLPLRQKISANAVWMIDMGLRLQSAYPNSCFSVLLGCKYNQWGQARSMGKMSQQGAHKIALGHPLRIKTIYQFAPYLGVQWNF